MGDLVSDVRFGLRMLRKRAGTSVLAIAALALGIGLTTTMFSIVQGVILRGLPFPESDRIMHLGRMTGDGTSVQSAPPHDFVDWSGSQTSFESLSAFSNAQATIADEFGAERYRLARLTPNTLRVLRVAPVLGRDFTEADGQPGAPPVILIGDQAWNSQFQRSPSVINKAVRLNGSPATIIGVMPPRFGFPNSQQIWTPLQVTLPDKRGTGQFVDVIGRLKPGSSLEQASAEFDAIGRRLRDAYPENKDVTVRVQPFMSRFIPAQISRTFFAMLAAVFGVMLIACTNVANLQLARAAERMRELALRMALGAGRGRMMRQMLVEGLILAAAGALVGLGIARIGIELFNRNIGDTSPPFWIDIRLDPTVLTFVTALTVIAALAASLIPALRATRQDVNAVLKDEGRGNTGLHMGRFSRGLVIVEVLLSCCLLIVSGLMIKGVVNIGRIAYPYSTEDVFVAGMTGSDVKYPDEASRAQLLERIETALKAVPGVKEIALSSGTPENTGTTSVAIDGATYPTPADRPSARRLVVSTRFFETLRVRPLGGRMFSSLDVLGLGTCGNRGSRVRAEAFQRRGSDWPAHQARQRREGALAQHRRRGAEARDPEEQSERDGDRLHSARAVAAARRDRAGLERVDSALAHLRVPKGGRERGPRPGVVESQHPRPVLLAAILAVPSVRRLVHVVRVRGAAAGQRRSLRRDGLLGAPANERDRCPDGTRRAQVAHRPDGSVSGHVALRGGRRAGAGSRLVSRRCHARDPLQRVHAPIPLSSR